MRQKRIKDVEKKVLPYSAYLVTDPEAQKGHWRSVFSKQCRIFEPEKRKLYLEIGCGKGLFIKTLSSENHDALYLAAEGQMSVAYRALTRAAGTYNAVKSGFLIREDDVPKPNNLLLMRAYIFTPRDYFALGEVNGIYLNFSDPWPKSRHEKRRVTAPEYLAAYRDILHPGGFLHLKTDNDALFDYSEQTIRDAEGFQIVRVTRDLHRSAFAEENVLTEYERKWMNLNRKIKYLLAIKN
ncbi:MAG: tRNA (guanosine(46)-N7)-methyltransferase TrmB [Clostridiales Family XIII bacterium]|jgi:tRNA (guanine-N7-)-methyltransferase|nr:tRNA (guanosine(46)-N7)-methyltransferase TrmB [Clostridiales Family XIII bacterium]